MEESTERVYIVQYCYNYEGCEVAGVFKDREAAHDWLKANPGGDYDIINSWGVTI